MSFELKPELFVVGFATVLGAVLGSFLNVCILRWSAEPKQSVVRPPSRCPVCGHEIRWYENVPVFSWILLRGRCSGCGTAISPMYPAIEALTALIWGGSVALLGLRLSALELAVAATLLVGIAVSDARAYVIPHEFSLGGTALAFAFALAEPTGVVGAIAGALFGAGVVLLTGELTELALGQEAMGGGDCALMGMVGAFFGWEGVWPVLALGAFISVILYAVAALRTAPADAPTEAAGEPRGGLRWGAVVKLLGGGLVLLGLMGVAVRSGFIGVVLGAVFYGALGAGAAYYLSFLLPRRAISGRWLQVWGLLGAAAGVALGLRSWVAALAGAALAAGALGLAGRAKVTPSPESTEELSAHGYLPFGVGLSIAAGLLAFTGGFERVRQAFADIAPALGLS